MCIQATSGSESTGERRHRSQLSRARRSPVAEVQTMWSSVIVMTSLTKSYADGRAVLSFELPRELATPIEESIGRSRRSRVNFFDQV